MTTQHDERAAFEEEYRLMFPVSSADPKKFEQNGIGGYEDFQVNNAWRFWQARAALLAADAQAGGEAVAWALAHSHGLVFSSSYPIQKSKEAAEDLARRNMGDVKVVPLYTHPQPQAVAQGWKLLKDSTNEERSWYEDKGNENGSYYCTCSNCGRAFTGHKRRVVCRVCSASPAAPAHSSEWPETPITQEAFNAWFDALPWYVRAMWPSAQPQAQAQAQPAAQVAQPLTDYKAMYHELLFAVGNKYPDETRHQTALRYIRQAEELKTQTAQQTSGIGKDQS